MSDIDPHWLKNMINRVKSSNDPTELIEAINSYPTGLLSNQKIREVIIESLEGNHLKKARGRRALIERNTRIWIDMTVMKAEGKTITEASEVVERTLEHVKKEMESQGLQVGKEFAITAEHIAKVYRAENKRRNG